MNHKKLIFLLGNLTAFGPFLTDFYLPAFPELTRYFNGTPSAIQLSLTAGMLGLAFGQLLIGPITDKFGRKNPLLVCLLLFILATIGCLLSRSIGVFIFFRLLQGLTGSCGLVVSKAIIADSFTAFQLGRFFAILAAIQGSAPIVAPVLGGVALSLSNWQGTFVVLGAWGLALFFFCRTIQETLKPEERLKGTVLGTFKSYVPVFKNTQYLVMNLVQAFSAAAMLCYISASPFIFQEHFGVSPLVYGIIFAANALALVAGSTMVMRTRHFKKWLRNAVIGQVVFSVLTGGVLIFGGPLPAFEVALVPMLFCVGMVTPLGNSLAVNSEQAHRGIASALLGSIPFILGSILAPFTGLGSILVPTAALMAACSVITLVLLLISRRWKYRMTRVRQSDPRQTEAVPAAEAHAV